jgi:hypothetical protein
MEERELGNRKFWLSTPFGLEPFAPQHVYCLLVAVIDLARELLIAADGRHAAKP